jgi:hypothetical protein
MGLASSTLASARTVQPLPNTSGLEQELMCSPFGDLLISEGFPRYATQSNLGNMVTAVTTTGVAGVTTVPTTTGHAQLYNGEGLGGKSYILTHIGMIVGVADATQADGHVLIYNLQTAANIIATGVPTDATNTKRKMNCNAYGGNARISLSMTVVNNGWMYLGNNTVNSAAAAGTLWLSAETPVEGAIVVPPGAAIAVAALVGAAAAALQHFFTFRWIEMVLPAAV